VFPAETGLKSLYVVFSRPARLTPGTVTGIGEDVSGIWLEHARSGPGAPIPTSVAATLRGREFSSFDSFRRAFWVAASKDTALTGQISEESLERMRSGKAPRTRLVDAAGKRISHEIHHVELISQGGEVYNVDNLRVHTPKNHVEVHQN
jgi:hypothetical protein